MNYFYSREYLEEQADKINMKYYPERLSKVSPFNHYDFLEKLGLEVEWKYISPDDSILGMYFFEDGMIYVWPNGKYQPGDQPVKEYFKKKTVVINQIILDKKNNEKQERFLCNHEVSHSIKDTQYFIDHPSNMVQICGAQNFGSTYWDSKMSEIAIIERQTNYLNAAILLPRDVVKREFFRRLRYTYIPEEPIAYTVYMKKHIAKLADEYGVNYNVLLYRLYDLNILSRNKS